jgi:Helix-turn-helix domain
MTHPVGIVAQSLELAAEGRSATEVARLLGIPRATVRDWMYGRVPKRSRARAGGCRRCGDVHDFGGVPPEYVYLLGMYLGDGCLSAHRREVFKLRISLDARYPEIVDECRAAMRTVMPRSRVNLVDKRTWFELYSYSKAWPCLFPQHGPGKKHERPIVLAPWQCAAVSERPDLLLRGLLHSDGCRFQNTGRGGWSHPRYAFANASHDIRAIFCAACELLGLRWTSSGDRTIYVSRVDDVALLDLFVGPKR